MGMGSFSDHFAGVRRRIPYPHYVNVRANRSRLRVVILEEGWEADVVRGKATDDFALSVITRKCGLVEYLKSEGMTDYLKYCNFSDFIVFPAMNIGLKQPCTIDNGQCVYCMKYKGQSENPSSLDVIYNPTPV